jgi:hypothetical protein
MNWQMIRVGALVLWTLFVAVLWGAWTLGALEPKDGEVMGEAAQGVVILTTGGCCSVSWLGGLLALAAVSLVVRR